MKITSIETNGYSYKPTGTVSLISEDGTYIRITLSEEESHRIHTIGLDIWRARQAATAKSIADMTVPMLTAPAQDADFDEVAF